MGLGQAVGLVSAILISSIASAQTRPATAPATRTVRHAGPAFDFPTKPATRPDRTAELLAKAEAVAAELQWLEIGDVIYDRPLRNGPDAETANALWQSLRDSPEDWATGPNGQRYSHNPDIAFRPGPWTADEIRPLLKHQDAKVRTLGVALMYQLNRVDVLADLVEATFDTSPTFPGTYLGASFRPGVKPAWKAQTVKDFAVRAIDAYTQGIPEFQNLQFDPTNLKRPLREVLAAFSAKRDPRMCVESLRVAMERATGGISPIQADRRQRIEDVLTLLHRIDMPRRFFVSLSLNFETYAGERYAPDYLLNLARQLPHDMRMKAAMGEKAIDDPDIGAVGADYFQDHVVELFRASDADAFIKAHAAQPAGRQPSGQPRSRMLVMAARLRPDRAEALLLPELDALTGTSWVTTEERVRVAVVLVELGGDAGIKRAVDAFFETRPEPGAHGFGREAILNRLQASNPAKLRRFTEAIIRDDRLTTLGPASSRLLLLAVHGYLGRALSDDATIRDSYGIDEFQRDRKFAALPAWHEAMKKTVDEWSKP